MMVSAKHYFSPNSWEDEKSSWPLARHTSSKRGSSYRRKFARLRARTPPELEHGLPLKNNPPFSAIPFSSIDYATSSIIPEAYAIPVTTVCSPEPTVSTRLLHAPTSRIGDSTTLDTSANLSTRPRDKPPFANKSLPLLDRVRERFTSIPSTYGSFRRVLRGYGQNTLSAMDAYHGASLIFFDDDKDLLEQFRLFLANDIHQNSMMHNTQTTAEYGITSEPLARAGLQTTKETPALGDRKFDTVRVKRARPDQAEENEPKKRTRGNDPIGEDFKRPGAPEHEGANAKLWSVIGKETPLPTIISLLVQHGCQDVTESMDSSACDQHPFSSGGFGDIYRGRLNDGTPVAIKCMRIYTNQSSNGKHGLLKHTACEIYNWSKLNHHRVLKLLGLARFRGQIAMVSPWVEHGSLPQFLEQNPQVDRPQLCMRVAEGLAFLHQSNVVHGDLKGANILMSDDDEPLLADFGNSVLQELTLCFTQTTQKNNLSLRWTAPELLREEDSCGAAADVYALGMIILEVITGAVPYNRFTEPQVMFAVSSGRLPKRPEEHIPTGSEHGDALWSLLSQCWSSDPKVRPTAEEVWRAMEGITPEGLASVRDEV